MFHQHNLHHLMMLEILTKIVKVIVELLMLGLMRKNNILCQFFIFKTHKRNVKIRNFRFFWFFRNFHNSRTVVAFSECAKLVKKNPKPV